MTGLPANMYLGGVVAKAHIIAVISAIIPLAIFIMIPESIVRLVLVVFSSVLISCIVIYSIGLDKSEKHFVQEKVFSKVKLKNRK